MGKKAKEKEKKKEKKKGKEQCRTEREDNKIGNEVLVDCDDKKMRLDFSQRKDRFLIVTTVMGVLIFVLKYLMQVGLELFGTFYLHNLNIFGLKNVFISQEQIIMVIYISACICILVVFFIYCIFELSNLKTAECDLTMEVAADNWFALVFKVAMTLGGSNSIILVLVLLIFSDEKIDYYLFIGIVVLLIIILLVSIYLNKKAQKEVKEDNGFSVWNVLLIVFVHCFLSIVLFLFMFLVVHKEQGTLRTFFDNEDIILEFEGYYCPNEIKCIIKNGEDKSEQSYLFKEYGKLAYIEKVTAVEKGKDDNTNYEENFYCYKYLLDISDNYIMDNYEIDIIFEINETEYCIKNMFYYSDGELFYTKNLMQIDL